VCLPQEQEQYDGKGLGEVCLRHKSALQRNKEASEAAGSSSPTARVRTLPRSELHAKCVSFRHMNIYDLTLVIQTVWYLTDTSPPASAPCPAPSCTPSAWVLQKTLRCY